MGAESEYVGAMGTVVPLIRRRSGKITRNGRDASGPDPAGGTTGIMRERKKKRIGRFVLTLALLLMTALAGCGIAQEEASGTPPTLSPTVVPSPTPPPLTIRAADQEGRPALMELAEDGSFYPDNGMTRIDAAQILAGLLGELPKGKEGLWADLDSSDPRYAAAASLYASGLVKRMPGSLFRPEDELTRGDLATVLFKLSLKVTSEDRERVRQLARDLAAGALPGCGGDTSAGSPLTRGELATVWVRLAGWELYDEDRLILSGCIPADVTQKNEAWPYITTAVMAGTGEEWSAPAPGLYRLYGWLYAVDENGALVRDQTISVWTFGPDGRYTTGDERLDGYLAEAMRASGAAALEGEEALKAAYLYVKHNFEYEITPEDGPTEANGSTDWINTRAERFLRLKGGTCYGYASTFGLMARCLGEEAHIVAGQVNEYYTPHGFVIIPEDGINWVYDVELEDTRPERHADLDLFHIENFAIYMYWYQPAW